MLRNTCALLLLTGLVAVTGCGSGNGSSGNPNGTVTISQTAATVGVNQTVQFSATVAGMPSTGVDWEVNGTPGGDAAHGLISATGMFTAPAGVPSPNTVLVTAVSQADSSKSAFAVVTVAPAAFSNKSLNGRYAFSFSGQNSSGFLAEAGSFIADGNGNLTSGIEDVNSGGGIFQNVSFTGTYSIGADGRGSASLQTSVGAALWQFSMVNSNRALLIRFDSGVVTASGSIDKQTPSSFATSLVSGNYVFSFSGINSGQSLLLMAGQLVANGAGSFTSGVLDVNDVGTVTAAAALNGSYSISSTGRGTASLFSQSATFSALSFAFYVVDSTHLKFVELDTLPVVSGDLLQQANGPFNNSSLNGSFAFTLGGVSSTGSLGLGGVFSSAGNGTISAGGVVDINDDGGVTSNVTVNSSSYSVDNITGRGAATLNLNNGQTLKLAFYPAANGSVQLLETDTLFSASGQAFAQSGGPFGNQALVGSFAVNFNGVVLNTGLEEDIAGQVAGDQGGRVGGALDINNSLSTSTASTDGTFSVSQNGRGNLNLSVPFVNAVFDLNTYTVDSNTTLILDVDNSRVLVGVMQRQF
jgi:hypothetical protein